MKKLLNSYLVRLESNTEIVSKVVGARGHAAALRKAEQRNPGFKAVSAQRYGR